MARDAGYSLKQRLLVRLWGAVFIVLILSTVTAFALASRVGSIVYDRWLYDSAMTLADQVRVVNGRAVLDLNRAAVEMFEWDSVDHVFGEVTSLKSGLLFSNARFPRPPDGLEMGQPRFYDAQVNGKMARIVAVRLTPLGEHGESLAIQVAETKAKRSSLLAEILRLSLPLQAVILLVTFLLVWFAVTSSLRAVDEMTNKLADYDSEHLAELGELDHQPNELRPLVDSINRLIAKLANAQTTQRRFIANAAHQLRTPLATLQVQTERALREPDRERHREALVQVLKAITRSHHLVHQLLTLARSDQLAEKSLDMAEVDLAELARDELEQWADAAIARGIDLGYDGPEQGVALLGEATLLREMIGNLVDNAIRYGKPGGQVTLGLSGSPPILFVDDDGSGIPAEERALVFERFYRRPGAESQGCGLGLPIAQEIASRHRASLRILDNPAGQGTRIEIRFS